MREPRPPYIEQPIEGRLELVPPGPLPRIHDGDPIQYTRTDAKNFTPEEDEIAFTQLLVSQGVETLTTRQRQGPHHELFTRFMRDLQANLHAIDSSLTPEHLAGFNYQSDKTRQEVAALSKEQSSTLSQLKQWRIDALGQLADYLIPSIERQSLAPDVLDTPPYYPSKHDWDDVNAAQGCTNACFRMIHGGITGETPSQTALSSQLVKKYDTSIVHDEVLTNLMKTPAFKETYGKEVHTVEYIGADLEHIQKAVSLIKRHRPESRVYCLINLGSASDAVHIWHSSILLAADQRRVAYHDPSDATGGAYHTLDKKFFFTRWAQTYNRAKLIISA